MPLNRLRKPVAKSEKIRKGKGGQIKYKHGGEDRGNKPKRGLIIKNRKRNSLDRKKWVESAYMPTPKSIRLIAKKKKNKVQLNVTGTINYL